MSSDLRASLLELGFNLSQARAAVAAGNTSIEAATEWIFDHNSTAESGPDNAAGGQNTLHLRSDEDQAFDEDLQKAIAESTRQQPAPQLSIEESSTAHPPPAPSTEEPAKKIKINIIRNEPVSQVTAPLPLTSRHKNEELDALNATRVAEAEKRADKLKKDKREARLAHQRALNDLKEDKERRKIRSHHGAAAAAAGSFSQGTGPSAPQQPLATLAKAPAASSATVQIRMKSGAVLKRSFASSATIKDLFELTRSEDGHIGSADVSLIQAYPRREFTVVDSDLTLAEAGLCPSCSLNVFVQTPIPAPRPIVPGAWLPPDIEMDEPSVEDQDELMPGHEDGGGADDGHHDGIESDEDYVYEDNEGGHGHGHGHDEEDDEQEEEVEGEEEEEEDEEDDGEEDDDMMHALPIHIDPHQNPFAGRGRGRGGGRGRGMPFSGVGHTLSSVGSASGTTEHGARPRPRAVENDALRRQRVLDATSNRARDIASAPQLEGRSKKLKARTIPTLQALCSHEVAAMLTANDVQANKHLKALKEDVGSQVAESIVQELVRIKQLDQLSLKRLHRCSLVNMVLDAYSRATDSLMDTLGAYQARSLTSLSLKECTFLTDRGFQNIGRFEELEFLDLSYCRITDKTLEFTLNLPNLSTLHLSSTKVTSSGLAKIIAEAHWKSKLHTLDVSYCQGFAGNAVMVNLQELHYLRTLKMNNTLAFNQSHTPVLVPDSRAFSRLLDLDIAMTPIQDDDLISLLGSFKALRSLKLKSCPNLGTRALEQCVQNCQALHQIEFPNREHDLLTILPTAAALPLTHLDLTGFLFVTDDAILALTAAKSLQMLSLAGTRLTDVGSAVFAHMSSLRELSLDRTNISDKSIEYLRDLGRLEILSLHRCQRLTVAGVIHLGKCAFFSLRLKRLNLGYDQFVHDEALAVLTGCKELVTLNLEYTDVTEGLALQLQNTLPNLTQLRIQGVTNGEVYKENPRGILAST